MQATIGKILSIEPILGADRVDLATVICGGAGKWKGVVAKGELTIGELVAVFLQDAILPEDSRWSFMAKSGWRVKMQRFRGAPSECLIIKTELPDGSQIGDNMMEYFGVTKYEKLLPVSQGQTKAISSFPSFLPKTDEPNFQRIENWRDLVFGGAFYVTLKMDGTSCTVFRDEKGLHVCSRNQEVAEFTDTGKGNVYWDVTRKYGLDLIPEGFAIQFEICGPSIQGNPAGLKDTQIYIFSMFERSIIGDEFSDFKWVQIPQTHWFGPNMPAEIKALARYVAPLVPLASASGQLGTEEDLRSLANITYPNGAAAEGIVVRALNQRWSFKVINLEYKE